MKKISIFLFGLSLVYTQPTVFCAQSDIAIAPDAAIAQDIATITATPATIVDKYEAAKWLYIEKYFTPCMNTPKIKQKIGWLLKDYSSSLLIIPAGILGVLLTAGALDLFFNLKDSRAAGILAFIAAIPETLGIIKGLQALGKKLECKDVRCAQFLTSFVKDWETNKEKTPTALQPMFEDFSQELAINSKLNKVEIDKKLAQKIVETIVAAAMIVNTIK